MPCRPCVLLSSGRKGTFLILTALKRHPRVRVYVQLLGSKDYYPDETGEQILARLFDECPESFETAVLPVAWYNARKRHLGFWEGLRKREVSVIHLSRRNMLRWYVSMQVASNTNKWSVIGQRNYTLPTITVNPDDCVKQIMADSQADQVAREFFAEHRSIQMTYEDVTHNFDVEMARLQEFLGAAPMKLVPRTEKQETRPLRDVIKNFDKLRRRWAGTKWAAFLEDGTEPAVTALAD